MGLTKVYFPDFVAHFRTVASGRSIDSFELKGTDWATHLPQLSALLECLNVETRCLNRDCRPCDLYVYPRLSINE